MSDKTAAELDAEKLSPVILAFMGDAVYETLVRSYLINMHVAPAKIHHACVGFVKASAQAEAVRAIISYLSPQERTILRRGRNANTTHVPKNAVPSDYRYATGLEALFGYLYFCGKEQRINEIFDIIANSNIINISEL
jgi:ribonuclease-3 family protein